MTSNATIFFIISYTMKVMQIGKEVLKKYFGKFNIHSQKKFNRILRGSQTKNNKNCGI